MNISPPRFSKKASAFLNRYSFVMFFVFIATLLSISVLIMAWTVLTPQDDGYVSDVNDINFDEDTIKRLKALRGPTEANGELDIIGRSPF